jgi:SpoVK/Ycf46/Vps4 family AAA+-type ATPase
LVATSSERDLNVDAPDVYAGLLSALERLDGQLSLAVSQVGSSFHAEETQDAYRGLYVDARELERLLARRPVAPALATAENGLGVALFDSLEEYPARLAWLAEEYGLTPFDLDLLLVAVAPELDLRYERIYAYIQDDVMRKRPTVELALNLLCASAEEKLARRAHFESDSALVGNGLLRLVADPNHVQPPLLSHYLKPSEQLVRLLLGQKSPGAQLSTFCRLSEAGGSLESLPLPSDVKAALKAFAAGVRDEGHAHKFYFHGPRGGGKRITAEAFAADCGLRLLAFDVAHALSVANDFDRRVEQALREARFQDALLYLEGVDALQTDERANSYRRLLAKTAAARGVVVLAGEGAPGSFQQGAARLFDVHLAVPDFNLRRACWREGLERHDIALEESDLDALAARFRLTQGQIAAAVGDALDRARWREAARSQGDAAPQTGAGPTAKELFASARAQSSLNLAALARKIEPKYEWGDIVLPPDQLALLREIRDRARLRHVVYGEWGFERKLSLGKGLNVLFSGPPGTGKTMAAEVLAAELSLDLYKIDLSQVVSKYIGETEKNLHQIFQEAQASDAVLFFDEADALFGKRSDVKDAHDRYANIEVGYLLQKMEEYDGIAILATNLRQNLDEAFMRRLHAVIDFPFPDEEHRRLIWQSSFPPGAPLAEDVDFAQLAREVRLAGGNIKSIGLAAAFYAAGDGGVIRRRHLLHAARREFQKLGRAWDEGALAGQGEAHVSRTGEAV